MFVPDLVARQGNQALQIEVEIGRYKNERERTHRWGNVADANAGRTYKIAPDRKSI